MSGQKDPAGALTSSLTTMAQTQNSALVVANAHVKRSKTQTSGPYQPLYTKVPHLGIMMTWYETEGFTTKVEEGTIFKVVLSSFYTDRAYNIDDKHVTKGLAVDFAKSLDENDPKTGMTGSFR
ncbi:hypothetical protein CFRS1_v007722 [Colletotrichum fructicola]|nr:hypothetical protein CFRS1_v007722 [Colletotrichum fructicola]